MLKYSTYKELEKMNFKNLELMYQLLFDEKEKKQHYIDLLCNNSNNDELMLKLIKNQKNYKMKGQKKHDY